ncbi:hypothetical protein [Thiohalobacter thiocyanaticus]|uniref:hypothetical protein n=1 Tax=Thiohalobacter thiocyanaticus TaxID=585455 RepID=UPI000BBAD4F2|nr:hypothetical protein [Thiohalobacter thiocyanaticus]
MTASTEQFWFTRRAGQVRGPYQGGEISRYILLGRLREADEISPDRHHWRQLGDHPELIPEVMRDADSEAGRRRLAAARAEADERSTARVQPRRLDPPCIERRNGQRRVVMPLMHPQAGAVRRPLATAALMFGLTGLALLLV